jgi:hypothetical protein
MFDISIENSKKNTQKRCMLFIFFGPIFGASAMEMNPIPATKTIKRLYFYIKCRRFYFLLKLYIFDCI